MTNLIIRPVHPGDISDLYEMITDPSIVSTLIFVPTMEYPDEEKWLKEKKPGSHRLVAELNGKVVGSATIRQNLRARLTHSGSVGLLVHTDYWGQGIGSTLMAELLDLADNWLGLMRVELEVFSDNPAAIHIYKKFGFEIEGTRRMAIFGGDGRFHDEHLMARLRKTPDKTNLRPPADYQSTASNKILLSAENIAIRPQHPHDTTALHAIRRHPLVARTTLQIPSLEYPDVLKQSQESVIFRHRFVAEADGRVVGSANLTVHQIPRSSHVAGLGMMVHPDYWSQGIGSKLMDAILNIADNWLNLKRVELEVHTDNPAGVHLYRKFGFEIEGTKRFQSLGDGRWTDSYFMARLRGDD